MIQRIGRADRDLMKQFAPYLMRLETQLRVPSRFKSLRRNITDWSQLSQSKRVNTVSMLYNEMRRTGKTGELMRSIGTMNSYKQFAEPEKSGVLKRVGIAGAGAVAGAALGNKIGNTLGKDPDKYKKAGAGIGAVAGYWAGK